MDLTEYNEIDDYDNTGRNTDFYTVLLSILLTKHQGKNALTLTAHSHFNQLRDAIYRLNYGTNYFDFMEF